MNAVFGERRCSLVPAMSLHEHNGKTYCDASDLKGLVPRNTLYRYLGRARKQGGSFENIANPFFNNKNSRRWVLLESLPPDLRQQVEQSIKKAGVLQEKALAKLSEKGASVEAVSATATQVTSEAVLSTQPALREALQSYLDTYYERYLEHYFMQGQPYSTAYRYARTCAFVDFLYHQESTIFVAVSDERGRRLHLRSLHANVHALLEATDLVISVQKSAYYRTWWQHACSGLQAGKSFTEVVVPLRTGNQNTRKLHAEATKYLDHLYVSGAALPAKQIYQQLLAYAKEQGWWLTEEGFRPPHYRTITRYLECRQADLAQARQGDAAVYNHYLAQISRTLSTQKNTIWGADATAHNELVFHNGRTRQCIHAVYIFDYASGKLLASAPYLTGGRHGHGERAETYVEALSEAMRSTGFRPQVLQIDQGPAAQEVKKWTSLRGIKVIPAGVKNERAKLVEGLLARLQNLIIRYRSGWSGQNLKALGPSSHPSPEQLTEHAKTASSAVEAMAWMQREQLEKYNETPFEQHDGQPSGQNPDELWTTLPSATQKLPKQQLATYAGRSHRVKFTKAGLTVYRNKQAYTYYPDVSTEATREAALRLFSELKLRSPEGSKRTLYVLDYAKGAYVFDRLWEAGGKYLGFWPLQKKVSMMEALEVPTSQHFKDLRALQQAQKIRMQEASKAAREWRPLNKERLQKEELRAKQEQLGLSDKELEAYRKLYYKEMVHPATGEVHWVPKNTNEDEENND